MQLLQQHRDFNHLEWILYYTVKHKVSGIILNLFKKENAWPFRALALMDTGSLGHNVLASYKDVTAFKKVCKNLLTFIPTDIKNATFPATQGSFSDLWEVWNVTFFYVGGNKYAKILYTFLNAVTSLHFLSICQVHSWTSWSWSVQVPGLL